MSLKHIRAHSPCQPKLPAAHELSKSAERFQGSITLFNEGKGFGFIKPDDGAEDIFFGRREASRLGTVSAGTKVYFSRAIEYGGRVTAVDLTLEKG